MNETKNRVYLVLGYNEDDIEAGSQILQIIANRVDAITYAWELDLVTENLSSVAVYSYEPVVDGSKVCIFRLKR